MVFPAYHAYFRPILVISFFTRIPYKFERFREKYHLQIFSYTLIFLDFHSSTVNCQYKLFCISIFEGIVKASASNVGFFLLRGIFHSLLGCKN